MTNSKPGLLHTPDYLRGLAVQMRSEADRADARAADIELNNVDALGCESGCWNILSTCINIQPL